MVYKKNVVLAFWEKKVYILSLGLFFPNQDVYRSFYA